MIALWQDIRYGLRLLRNSPGVAAIAALTLGLGIGANTAIFSLVDVVMFRPLPIEKPGEVVRLTFGSTRGASQWGFASFPSYLEYSQRSDAFSGMFAYLDRFPVTVSAGKLASDRVDAGMVTGNYFSTLGVHASIGRTILPDDDRSGAPPVVMISHEYWKRRFASATNAIGLDIQVDGQNCTIVGVAPAGFGGVSFENLPEVWLPIAFGFQIDPILRSQIPLGRRSFSPFAVGARLKPGISLLQAQAQLNTIAVGLGAGKPVPGEKDYLQPWPTLVPAAEQARKFQSKYSLLMLGVVALVLMIACADATALLLARAERRQKEVTVRLALGATRVRIARSQMVEGLLVSLLGAIIAAPVAGWAVQLLDATAPPTLTFPLERAVSVLDFRALGFTALIAISAGVMSSLVPAWSSSRSNLAEMMKAGTRTTKLFSRRISVQNLLIVTQIATSVVLLVGAGLLLRTLWEASRVPLGFDPDHSLVASTDPGRQGYDSAASSRLLAPLLDSLRAEPGVESAALASSVPLQPGTQTQISPEGHQPANGQEVRAQLVRATPGYFETLGIPLLKGRDFTHTDIAGAPGVAIVSVALAQKFWPGQDPIGKSISHVGAHDQTLEVVGVAANVASEDPREPVGPVVYAPLSQSFQMFPWQPVIFLLVRTRGDPGLLGPAVRTAVARVNPTLVVPRVRAMREQVARTLAEERFLARLLVVFALLATLLSAAGVYGLVSYTTQGATRDLGVRMALGAQSGDVLRLVIGKGLVLTTVGLTIGLAAAGGLTRLLRSFLFGVSATDPITFVAVALFIATATAAACYLPARRATQVDPLLALRHE